MGVTLHAGSSPVLGTNIKRRATSGYKNTCLRPFFIPEVLQTRWSPTAGRARTSRKPWLRKSCDPCRRSGPATSELRIATERPWSMQGVSMPSSTILFEHRQDEQLAGAEHSSALSGFCGSCEKSRVGRRVRSRRDMIHDAGFLHAMVVDSSHLSSSSTPSPRPTANQRKLLLMATERSR